MTRVRSGVAGISRHAGHSAAGRPVASCLGVAVAALVLLIVTPHRATATTTPTRATAATQAVGPGRVNTVLYAGRLTLRLSIRPNVAAAWNTVVLAVSDKGQATRHAAVTVSFTMLNMSMGTLTFRLSEQHPGEYSYVGPATTMPGAWKLAFQINPQAGAPVTASVDDLVQSGRAG